jgi:disulfide bond formation protein DsbB
MKNLAVFFADKKNLSLAAVAVSIGALVFAYTAQYGFNLLPCPLCLEQRKPYFAIIVLGLAALYYANKKSKVSFWLLLLCGLAFLTGVGISGFHTGVEQGWWKGLEACGDSSLPVGASIEELKEYLINRPIVRCDVPAWQMFGISMTGYNFLLSLSMAVFIFYFTLRGHKK